MELNLVTLLSCLLSIGAILLTRKREIAFSSFVVKEREEIFTK